MSAVTQGRAPVQIITQFYFPETAGTAFYTHRTAQNLSRTTQVNVITGEPYYPAFSKWPEYRSHRPHETVQGIPVERIRTLVPSADSALSRIASDMNFLIRGLLRVRRTEVTGHTISFTPGLAPALLARTLQWRRRGRHIVIVHDIQSGLASGTSLVRRGSVFHRSLGMIEAWALNGADIVAALGETMATELRSLGVAAEKLRVLPIWLRGDIWDNWQGPQPLANDPVVAYSGTLGGKHATERLTLLARELQERVPTARMIVRGAGPGIEQIRDACSDPDLPIDLKDFVPDKELPSALSSAWLHVLPQRNATATYSVPSKVINILAAGRPLVAEAEDDSPLHQLAESCPAVIVTNPARPEELFRTVISLLQDPHRISALGDLARDFAVSTFSEQTTMEQLESMLFDPCQD